MDVGCSGIKRREPFGRMASRIGVGEASLLRKYTALMCRQNLCCVVIELRPGFGPEKQDSGPGFASGFCEVLGKSWNSMGFEH